MDDFITMLITILVKVYFILNAKNNRFEVMNIKLFLNEVFDYPLLYLFLA
jgi:hypothetical protein